MPMTNLRSYHWRHRFYWAFFNLACCEVWFQLTRHDESITCWSPVWMNLHTASFLPCCPATIATTPVVNLPARQREYQPGTLPWALLPCRCAERIRGLDVTPSSVPDLSFLPVSSGASKKPNHSFKTAKSIQSNCRFHQRNSVWGWNLLISWAKLLMKELMKWSQSC